MNVIYYIAQRSEYMREIQSGAYKSPTLSSDGFIHCAYREQVLSVADAFYRGKPHHVLLEIDTTKLHCRVADENCDHESELYPHVYGRFLQPPSPKPTIFPAKLRVHSNCPSNCADAIF